MTMLGTSFFRSSDEKCPNCGHFSDIADESVAEDNHTRVCPSCSTTFNKYLVLQEGRDVEFQNH